MRQFFSEGDLLVVRNIEDLSHVRYAYRILGRSASLLPRRVNCFAYTKFKIRKASKRHVVRSRACSSQTHKVTLLPAALRSGCHSWFEWVRVGQHAPWSIPRRRRYWASLFQQEWRTVAFIHTNYDEKNSHILPLSISQKTAERTSPE
jgi:hypothetical protein